MQTDKYTSVMGFHVTEQQFEIFYFLQMIWHEKRRAFSFTDLPSLEPIRGQIMETIKCLEMLSPHVVHTVFLCYEII